MVHLEQFLTNSIYRAKTDKVSREQSWQVIADLAIKNSTNGPAATPEQRAKAVDAVLEEIEQFDPNDQMFKDISAVSILDYIESIWIEISELDRFYFLTLKFW